MNNKYILLFGLSMLFSACSDAPGLTLTAASFTEEQLPSCQQRTCPSITVNYIVVGGETEVADSINAAIAEFVSTSLMGNEETGNRPHSDLKAAAVDFAQLYFNDKAEFPDMAGTYE
ncbi:MAG: hypothetical protein CMC08_08655, partial [Flavobacteriaceae bacterium]|nr:hypothetical protein [Flavobacteriaceae bacterium]